MNEKVLEITDQSLQYSLWSLLIFFSLALFYIAIQLPRRRQRFFLRSAAHALLLSGALGVVFFLFISFTPLPFRENFATVPMLEVTPLRLTALTFERFHEGFSLQGEVWNQTTDLIEGLKVIVRVWGSDRQLLEEVELSVTPRPLPAGSAGIFQLRYPRKSPFLYGYDIYFIHPDGEVIPHIKGFDVH